MLTLVSHPLCPYVQRAAIALAEKGVAFERITIDLDHKPAWFDALSPLGKVPLLQVRRDDDSEAVLFESAAICEYIDESQPGPTLLPGDALQRAQLRAWMEFGSSVLAEIWGLETAPDAATHQRHLSALDVKFARLEAALGAGPFFLGASFSIVDAYFAPVFRYFDTFDRLFDSGVFERRPKLRAWRKVLAERPSVRNAVGTDYGDRLLAFLRERNAYGLRAA